MPLKAFRGAISLSFLIAAAAALLLFFLLTLSETNVIAQTDATATPEPSVEVEDEFGNLDLPAMIGKLNPPKYANMDSNLNDIVQQFQSGQFTARVAAANAPIHSEESVAVTVHVTEGYADTIADYLDANGASSRNIGTDYIEAYVPVSLLPEASTQDGVISISTMVPPVELQGKVVSEGVSLHGATAWHDAGLRGQGVNIGIIDTGFQGFRSLMGTELPSNVEPRCYTEVGVYSFSLNDCDNSDQSRHGSAVAEALFDIAPEATYYIANPMSKGDLASAVNWMIDHDVSIINHSVGWTWDGPGDGSSPFSWSVLESVDAAIAGGIVWVNAAGNHAQATWFSEFSDDDGDGFHEYNGDDNCNNYALYEDGQVHTVRFLREVELHIQLRWDDRWGGANTDLNLILARLNETLNRYEPYYRTVSIQSGNDSDMPYERIRAIVPAGIYCLVVQHSGGPLPRWIQIQEFSDWLLQHHTRHHSISNPAESRNLGLLAVGAAPSIDTNTIEFYSSQGPTTDDGVKPDIVGVARAKSVTYRSPGNPDGRWFGTSQSSPHVAGLAALVKQQFPDYTPEEVANYLKSHAEPRGTVPNNTWGYGFARLLASDARTVQPSPTPTPTLSPTPIGSPTPSPTPTVTATPSPQPTSTPVPTATSVPDLCLESFDGNRTVNGTWSGDCQSSHSERDGHNARYYTFTLSEASQVSVTLESSIDSYLYMREGAGRDGDVVCENDDYGSPATSSRCDGISGSLTSSFDSGLAANLSEGSYTIEATTYSPAATGGFVLTVSFDQPQVQPGPTPSPIPSPSPTPVPLPPDYSIEDYACAEEDLAHLVGIVPTEEIGPEYRANPGYPGIETVYTTRWRNLAENQIISCTAVKYDSIANARWMDLNYSKHLQRVGTTVDVQDYEPAFIPWIGDDMLAYRLQYYADDALHTSATVVFLDAATITVSRIILFSLYSDEYPDIAVPEGIAVNIANRQLGVRAVAPAGGGAGGIHSLLHAYGWLDRAID